MKCEVCGRTDAECRIKKIKGKELCPKHLTQWYRHGEFLERTIYDRNQYVILEDHAEIILCDKTGKENGRALIDVADVEKCKKYKWHIRKSRKTNYVIASLPGNAKIHLHQYILDYYGALDIDHKNLNGLDNRKSNLRIITHSENLRNQSSDRKGIKKVPSGRYQVVITVNAQGIYLGTFDTYEQALKARLEAEKKYTGH